MRDGLKHTFYWWASPTQAAHAMYTLSALPNCRTARYRGTYDSFKEYMRTAGFKVLEEWTTNNFIILHD